MSVGSSELNGTLVLIGSSGFDSVAISGSVGECVSEVGGLDGGMVGGGLDGGMAGGGLDSGEVGGGLDGGEVGRGLDGGEVGGGLDGGEVASGCCSLDDDKPVSDVLGVEGCSRPVAEGEGGMGRGVGGGAWMKDELSFNVSSGPDHCCPNTIVATATDKSTQRNTTSKHTANMD